LSFVAVTIFGGLQRLAGAVITQGIYALSLADQLVEHSNLQVWIKQKITLFTIGVKTLFA